jgi:hypothetical protein
LDQIKWICADYFSGIQIDLYAGIHSDIMMPDKFGNYELASLENIKSKSSI